MAKDQLAGAVYCRCDGACACGAECHSCARPFIDGVLVEAARERPGQAHWGPIYRVRSLGPRHCRECVSCCGGHRHPHPDSVGPVHGAMPRYAVLDTETGATVASGIRPDEIPAWLDRLGGRAVKLIGPPLRGLRVDVVL